MGPTPKRTAGSLAARLAATAPSKHYGPRAFDSAPCQSSTEAGCTSRKTKRFLLGTARAEGCYFGCPSYSHYSAFRGFAVMAPAQR
jgi:hypothetical protein